MTQDDDRKGARHYETVASGGVGGTTIASPDRAPHQTLHPGAEQVPPLPAIESQHPIGRRFVDREPPKCWGQTLLYRARDRDFDQPVALKAIPLHAGIDQVATSLELRVRHPAIVRPLARWTEGGYHWLAMDWIEGGTLDSVLGAIYGRRPPAEATIDSGAAAPSDAPRALFDLPDALRMLRDAALAIGAAHREGVVHLDLKPDNIMFEMVSVRRAAHLKEDWRFWHIGRAGRSPGSPPERMPAVRLIDWGISREVDHREAWGEGPVPGVPYYMAPERIANAAGATAPTADVYALGAILYEVLSGRPPYAHYHGDLRAMVVDGPRPRLQLDATFEAYRSVIERAMAPRAGDRQPDATAFAGELQRARSLSLRGQAMVYRARATELVARADGERDEAARALLELDDVAYDDLEPRYAPWKAIAQADEWMREAAQREAQWQRVLQAILSMDPECAEVTADLLVWTTEQLQALQRGGDERAAAAQTEHLLSQLDRAADRFGSDGPAVLVDAMASARATLRSESRLSLRSLPGVQIQIAPQHFVHRRWTIEPGSYRTIGHERLDRRVEKVGRYMLRLSLDGHRAGHIPVRLIAGEDWRASPTEHGPLPLLGLPRLDEIDPDAVYVPPGHAWLGGEPSSPDSPRRGRRVWVPGFVVKRNPVTFEGWCAFLDDLLATGRDALAAACLPFDKQSPTDPTAPHIVRAGRRFELRYGPASGPASDRIRRWPVRGITWSAARVYSAWYAARHARDGSRPGWRLLSEWEYEKLARLSDERILHWGDHREPRFTRVAGSTAAQYMPEAVDADTLDVSLQGIRWLAGNAGTWCLDAFAFDAPTDRLDIAAIVEAAEVPATYRMVRGACFNTQIGYVSGATRFAAPPDHRSPVAGLRLARSLDIITDDAG